MPHTILYYGGCTSLNGWIRENVGLQRCRIIEVLDYGGVGLWRCWIIEVLDYGGVGLERFSLYY